MSSRRWVQRTTNQQLVAMRKSGLIVSDILDQLVAASVPGVATGDLDALARGLITEAGAVSSFLGYGSRLGLPPFPAVTCISVNEEVVHGIPKDRTLVAGDLVSIDFGVAYNGWHGDSARTLEVGAVSAEKSELSRATRQALWDGICAIKVGGRIGDISAAIESSLTAHNKGYAAVREFTGHGIGKQLHMDPSVPNFGKAGHGSVIKAGMCLAIEPIVVLKSAATLTLADEWTVVTRDGTPAAHWEHTVAVTKAGLWVLTAADGGEADLKSYGGSFAPLA